MMPAFLLRLVLLIVLATGSSAFAMDAENGEAANPASIKELFKPDPTKNVLDKVSSEVKRIDDLRAAEAIRIDQLMRAESRRVDEQASLRAEFATELRLWENKLREAESKRIDAIRAVDVAAVGVASERATQQATVLATQVTASADALRALVATTATTFQAQLNLSTNQQNERIAALEKASYETRGKSQVMDPATAAALSELAIGMKKIQDSQSATIGAGAGTHETWAFVVAGAGLLVAVVAVGVSFIKR